MWRAIMNWYREWDAEQLRVLADPGFAAQTPPGYRRRMLKDLLSGLDPERFWQIHRGTMVNVNAIVAAERVDAERLQVLVRGCDERLTVSRTFAHLFRD